MQLFCKTDMLNKKKEKKKERKEEKSWLGCLTEFG